MKKMIFLMTIFMIMACSKNEHSFHSNQESSKEPIGKELLSIGDLTVTPEASNPSSVSSKNSTLVYNVKNNSINSGFFTLNTLGFNFSIFSINYTSSTCLGSVLKVLGPADSCSIVVNFYTEASSGTYNSFLTLVDGKSQISLIQFPISINYVDSSTGTGSTPITGGCKVGYHLVGRRCVINTQTRACLDQPDHSVNGIEISTDGGNNWGACLGYTCQMNYIMDGNNICQPEVCTISNYYILSDILQDANIASVSGSYPNCTVTTCGTGYNVSIPQNKCIQSSTGPSIASLFVSPFNDLMYAEKPNFDFYGFAQGIDPGKVFTPSIPYNKNFYATGSIWNGMKDIVGGGSGSNGCFIGGNDLAYCFGSSLLGDNSTRYSATNAPTAVDMSGVLAGKTVKSLVSNGAKYCMIASDDLAYCWGYNIYGSLGTGIGSGTNNNEIITMLGTTYTPVSIKMNGALSGLTIKKIAMGSSNGCVIASNDQLYCWGYNQHGTVGNPNVLIETNEPTLVDTSLIFLNNEKVLDIAVGTANACLVDTSNRTFCWGINDYGGLGIGSGDTRLKYLKPTTQISGSILANQISTNGSSYCVVTTNKKGYCWGYGAEGQIGNGVGATNNTTPVEISATGQLSNNVKKIIMTNTPCAINTFNTLFCWGYNKLGQVGTGSTTPTSIKVPTPTGLSGITKVASIGESTCGLDSNSILFCWGGVGATTGTNVLMHNIENYSVWYANPTPILELPSNILYGKRILKVGQTSYVHNTTCVLADDNEVYCTGKSNIYDFGVGGLPSYSNYVGYTSGLFHKVDRTNMGAVKFKDLEVSTSNLCGIGTDDKAYCWGSCYSGQCGQGDSYMIPTLARQVVNTGAMANKTVKKIAVNNRQTTCAIASDDNVYCWGSNGSFEGFLGNSDVYSSYNKTKTGEPIGIKRTGALNGLTIKDLAGGNESFIALASNDKLYMWGVMYGESQTSFNDPIAIGTSNATFLSKSIKKVAHGGYHVCAVTTDNDLYCWGSNYRGQVGYGASNTTVSWKNPVLVNGSGVLAGKNIKDLKLGANYSCAVDIDDKYYCWGLNETNYKINSLVPLEAIYFNQ